MQYHKILNYFLFVIFICAVSQPAFSKNETFRVSSGISQDSISKNEIAEYRKNFESVEKMIASRRGSYDDAKRSFDGIRNSRVRNLPEFSGRFSTMQSKLSAWQSEVNPKQPPVVVPNPGTPTTTPKTTEKPKPVEVGIERKSAMLSYFPDTMTVGTSFLAYVEITSNGSVKFGNPSANFNSAIDSLIIGSSTNKPDAMNSMVTVDLRIDGGNADFTINPRSDKTRTLDANNTERWEWFLQPNAEGDFRLRLSVTYQKQNPDGSTSEVTAMNKVLIVKASTVKTPDAPSNNLPWIIAGILVLLAVIAFIVISKGKKKEERIIQRDTTRDTTDVR